MKHISTRLITLMIAAVILISPTDTLADETVLRTDQKQPIEGTLLFSAAPMKSMTKTPFRLNLADTENKRSIHSASCKLTMPAMAMPDNRPALSCSGSSCTGTAIFTMAGAWQATFGLIMQDGTHASIVFDIDMVKMK